MKETIAIFDFYIGGHHLEYIHHLYQGACLQKDKLFYFILPSSFNERKKLFIWEKAENIRFLFFNITDEEIRGMGLLKKSYFLSKQLKQATDKYNINKIILIETIVFLPYLPFLLRSNAQVSSIIYHLPFYSSEQESLKSRIITKVQFDLIGKCKCFKNVFLLNAKECIQYYNNKYKTKKFKYLPDPYTPLSINNRNLLSDLELKKYKFLHFGGMTKRKGTLEILKAIELLTDKELSQYSFIFAGRVIEDIKEEFYKRIEKLSNRASIIVFDQFCEYEFLAELCTISNFILIPYKNIAQSSGVCSYAAQFKTPVIGPEEGLLGEIIKRNGLGITIKNLNETNLASAISLQNINDIKINCELADKYQAENSIEHFNEIILQ